MFIPLLLASTPIAPAKVDPVEFSFAFFGCNRLEKEAWDKSSNPSSANLPQLRRTLADIYAIKPRPALLFATGDLVLGYEDDHGETVRSQLDAWIAEYRKSPLAGKIELIPIAGNHELNRKVAKNKISSPYTVQVWSDWLTRNGLMPRNPNGPTIGGPDHMVDDQSRLNFSIDRGPFHFVVLNTDSRVEGGQIGWIPAKWADKDIRTAAKAGKSIFVLGHRNLVDPARTTGDSPMAAEVAAQLKSTFQGAKSALAYICAHVHAWDVTRVAPNGAWQVIAGNGGSKLEPDWHPGNGTKFGFGVIALHKSGRITLTRYGRVANAMPQPLPAVAEEVLTLGMMPRR